MLIHGFGKNFDRRFIPRENDRPVNLPSQNPTIYIFRDQPSREQARNGTSAIQTISAWVEKDAPPYARIYEVSAIEDPNPNDQTEYEEYWEAINFVAKASGQVQTFIRMMRIERIESADSVPGTTRETLQEVYPAIKNYLSDDQMDDMIVAAEAELQTFFEGRDIKWSRVYGMYKFKLAVAYKAIALSALSQFREDGDRHHKRWGIYEGKCDSQLKQIAIRYDKNGDGNAEIKRKPATGSWDNSR